MKRRTFVKQAFALTALPVFPVLNDQTSQHRMQNKISIISTNSNFEREKLLHPFGFKGGYLTELWQTVVGLSSTNNTATGIATQSVLYGDADFFSSHSEAAGNALMYALTDKALQLVKTTEFESPVKLMAKIQPELMQAAINLTGKKDINKNFLLNALVAVDNAAWILYAAENGYKDFDAMMPEPYKKPLSFRNKKVAVMFQVSYGMPLQDIVDAVNQGYFVIKIKTGQPGTQPEMLQKDIERLTQIHTALKDLRTPHTANGKLIYTMDSNARYEKKETLLKYIDHARKIGALDQVLFIEEPLHEDNEASVADVGVRIGADESVHDEASALKRLKQGYGLLVLKGIAKTLSGSIPIAKLAYEHNVPCICADLTVNPILIDWNKNLAARVAPFPGLGMGMIETNGNMNYINWSKMVGYHPHNGALWTQVNNGVFELDDDFFNSSGGIFSASDHYRGLVD
ncbi:MAG: enolase C-terminal domain-like protein [Agriterribacter sp.]